jgi:hypothetical protein
MTASTALVGYRAGLAAFVATVAFVVVQVLQVAGALRFPADEILIYGTSLSIVVPLVLEVLAFHHVTPRERQLWSHGALVFIGMYAVFVSANYVVQLATVVPAKLAGTTDAVRLLDQTPHSLFWDFDALGYISMGIATALAIPALDKGGFERWVRWSLLANALVTPLIAIVYFYPRYSTGLLFLGFPWGVTAPLFMLMLALAMRRRRESVPQPRPRTA